MPNNYFALCACCRAGVAPSTGHVFRDLGRWQVWCSDCARPELERVNKAQVFARFIGQLRAMRKAA